MNVGILGSGDVAKALAKGFLSRGHSVKLGTRDAGKLAEWRAAAGDRASVGSFADAAQFGELIVLATQGTATVGILEGVGAPAFGGKIVIDATNPLRFDRGGPELAIGFTDSLGEQVQRAIPTAHVVKCYNTVGNALMIDPKVAGGPPDMFVAGNDEAAKRTVAGIVTDFGWNVIDLGGIEQARLLEPMCIVWVLHGLRSGTWNHAFKFVNASS
jgi:8-hydroxy-5-deazaflavin:NADPH oxidoreductase